ncbi:MAG: type I restriction-modification system subunit M N-terminal domain-containing protein, partial [Candidatus Rokubacteria bacterium]|nr:type I restriction-modification system subunit M N-terminal domain-containing protein [Candidatus Rokubacteria bacterium]
MPSGKLSKGKPKRAAKGNGANLGFEEKLWQAADKMRGHMDPGEYKHVALGLIFLKYISDAFEERRRWLLKEATDPKSEDYVREPEARYQTTEDRDEYLAENVFWVPKEA